MDNGGIFINYRRCDGGGIPRDHALFVEMLAHELAEHFGAGQVFIDTSTSAGSEYPDESPSKLGTCDVLLVVIHPEWLDDLGEQRNKLVDGEVDQVHHEISAALNGTLHSKDSPAHHPEVIPILLEKADPPKSAELPDDIRELALLQSFRVRFGSLTTDLTRLLAELEIHTITCWPPQPVPGPNTRGRLRGIFGRAVPGQMASRGFAAAAFAVSLSVFVPAQKSDWTSATFLLLSSAGTILVALLGVVAGTVFGRRLHRMEHHLHSLPTAWLSVPRLGTLAVAMLLFLPLIDELDETYFASIVIGLLGSIILATCIIFVTIRDFREDSSWPPQFSIKPRALRRTIVRLDQHLTSVWHPPLSRLQREQAWLIVAQLDRAVTVLRSATEYTRTRRNWIRTGRPGLAVGYAVWLAVTLGLAVASMQESFSRGYLLEGYLSVPIGVVACGLGIGTMELMFRNDRKAWRWFFEEIETNRENQLLRHMPTNRTSRP